MGDLMLRIVEAEQAVVGSMLIDAACIGDVLAVTREEDFITPRFAAIYHAARELFGLNEPVDAVTILNRVGPDMKDTLVQAMDETPTAANVLHYCSILRENAALLRLRQLARRIEETEALGEARDLLAEAAGALSSRPGVTVTTLAAMMADFVQRMGQPKPDYLHWGLSMLDGLIPASKGSYILLGARPSTGKTALALQVGLSIAKTKRVGFFSLETSMEVAGDRIAAAHLETTLPSIKQRNKTSADLQAFAYQLGSRDVFRRDFDFISGSSMAVAEIRSVALARKYDVVIIDYVQLIRPASRGERTEQMQAVSMELRAMAQLTGITVLALAQLRRPDTQGKMKAPTMADLKESGQFEQDADAILLLYREDPDNSDSDRWIKVEKNKEGAAGFRHRYRFDGLHQTFTAVAEDGKALEPEFREIEESKYEQGEIPFS